MKFRNRKASVLAVLLLVMVVQMVFSGVNSSADDGSGVTAANVAKADNAAAESGTEAIEANADLYTEEEIVSADLNVVYRSTLTSSETTDDLKETTDNSDFSNKIISYTCERLCVYAEANMTSTIVGVMYSGSQADIVAQGEEWTQITSGSVTGYVRNVDVLFGSEAEIIAKAIGTKIATVTVDNLTVLADADSSSEQISTLALGAEISAYDEANGFILIECDNGYGYIDSSCVTIEYGLDTAITIEEEQQRAAEEAAAAAAAATQKAAAEAAAAAANSYSAATTTTRTAYNATAEEIHLLAAIIYWEAGWEPSEGQIAVGNVVINRALSSRFKQSTISDVIYAAGQFTGVAENGAPSARFQSILNMSNDELNVRGCYNSALAVLSGQNNVGDLLFFISVKKANYAQYSNYTIINNHCFYIY